MSKLPSHSERAAELAVRRQVQGRHRPEQRSMDGARFALGLALAASVFLLVLAVSDRQVSEPENAQNVLAAGVAATTDIDTQVQRHHEEMRALADTGDFETLTLPGYPLDVAVTPDEVRNLNDEQLRDLILERSGALVYAQGVSAFDRTGNQDTSIFSAQGVVDLMAEQLSADANQRADLALVVFLLMTVVATIGIVLGHRGSGRVRAMGWAILAGTIPGIVFWYGVGFLGDRAGGDDAYVADLRNIVGGVLDVPLRNYMIAAVLGGVVLAIGYAMSRFLERDHGSEEVADFHEQRGAGRLARDEESEPVLARRR